MPEPEYDLAVLLPLLNDPDYRVQIRAAWTLAVERDPRAIEPMLQMLGDEMPYDEDASFNFLLCDALASYSEMAFEPVLRALAPNPAIERDGWRRYWVTKTLGYFGDLRAIPPLAQCLNEDSIPVVVGAGEALLDLADKSAIEPLQKALERYSASDGYVYTTLSNAIDELEAGIKYRPGDYKTEKLVMRLKKCHGLLDDGTRCTKQARRDSRFCQEHRKGEPRIPMPDLENPIFAGERFIPTSVRRGFRIGDKVHFGELLDGDKFRARGGKLFVKTPYHPYPGELHPSNAILDDYAAPTFPDDQLVTLVNASKPDSKRIVGTQMPFGDLEAGERFKVGDTVFTKRSDWQPSGNAIDEVEVFPEFSDKDIVEFAADTDSPWPDFVFEAE